jgi:hypothetical protein
LSVRVFPIRHHGPGSARALAASLDAWQPDAVLIEGPPEANPRLALAQAPGMRPPVALLAYVPSQPAISAFYPMAQWSPEWVALGSALSRGVPVTMIDLPAGVFFQRRVAAAPPRGGDEVPGEAAGDPISRLAEIAGYDDAERWWEDMVEHRVGEEPWDAVTEAMAELRRQSPPGFGAVTDLEAQREASMRQHIRIAVKRHQRVAVVCGAWHAPALVERGPANADAALLVGLRKQHVAVTWVPWTNTRLSLASGYGAGVSAPGWYEHLFTSRDRPIERWMAKVAALLRAEQLDAAPSSVVESVRLARSLATLRGRPLVGLSECNDAAQAVLGGGHQTALNLIARNLVVGDKIGEVPPETPTVPLAADLTAAQRRLRMKPQSGGRELDLDLRNDTDLSRSRLLHRLNVLAIPWGALSDEQRGTGTFREEWVLRWEPELAVRVIEASIYGTTVEAAATARAVEAADGAPHVAAVTGLIEQCLLAELPAALGAVMAALDTRAALSADVGELMDALTPLARVLRYGNVRRTEVAMLEHVTRGLVARVCASLGPASSSLDDAAATTMGKRIAAVSTALASADDPALRAEWLGALGALSAINGVHGLVAGRATRIVLDAGHIDAGVVSQRLAAALSRGEDPVHGAQWIEGLLSGSGLLLVHDRPLLALIDQWVASVNAEVFDDVLPLLRRTFSLFEPGERRLIATAAAQLAGTGMAEQGARTKGRLAHDVDATRGDAVLPALQRLLGLEAPT